LLARHLSQFDELQHDAVEGREEGDVGDDQPLPEVVDAILATSTTTLASEPSGLQSADDGEQGGEGSGSGDGLVVRNFRFTTDPAFLPANIPVESIRVDFTAGNLRFMTESTLDITFPDEGSSSSPENQSPATNTVAEDRAEVGTPTLPERAPEADSPPRTEVSQPGVSEGSVEPTGNAIPGRSPTPIYHDPHPPFETDGRGRVVWSNSSEQARLRSRSVPVQPRKSDGNETGVTSEKDSCGDIGPGIRTGDGGNAGANADSNFSGCGRETGVEGGTTRVP